MSSFSQVMLLARRELLQRVQTKAFLFTMIGLIILVIVSGPVITVLLGEDEPMEIGLVGTQPEGFAANLELSGTLFEEDLSTTSFDSLDAGETALEDGDVDVLLVDDTELVYNEEPGFFSTQIIQTALTFGEQQIVLDELGATAEQRSRLLDTEQLPTRTLVESNEDDEARQVAAFLALIVLYIAILVFGQFVAMGTVQEKQNRVIEVLLSKVTSSQILISKVLGIGLLGLGQLIALGLAGLITLNLVDADISLPGLGLNAIWGALLWFVLGYTLYAFIYATLGATVSRQEDLQGVLVIPLVLILPGYFVAQVGTVDPTTTLARVGALVPFWSPMLMPSRMATGHATATDIAIAIGLVLLTIVILVKIGSRVYEGALLRTGGRVKLSEAWRSARED